MLPTLLRNGRILEGPGDTKGFKGMKLEVSARIKPALRMFNGTDMAASLATSVMNSSAKTDLGAILKGLFSVSQLKKMVRDRLTDKSHRDQVRRIYFKSSNINDIFSEEVILKVFSYLEGSEFQRIPVVGRSFESIISGNPAVYNEMNYRVIFDPSRRNRWGSSKIQAMIQHSANECRLSRNHPSSDRVIGLESVRFPWKKISQWRISSIQAGYDWAANTLILELASESIESISLALQSLSCIQEWPEFPNLFRLELKNRSLYDFKTLLKPMIIPSRLTVLEIDNVSLDPSLGSFLSNSQKYSHLALGSIQETGLAVMIGQFLRDLTALRIFSIWIWRNISEQLQSDGDWPSIIWEFPASVEIIRLRMPGRQRVFYDLIFDLSKCDRIMGLMIHEDIRPSQFFWPDSKINTLFLEPRMPNDWSKIINGVGNESKDSLTKEFIQRHGFEWVCFGGKLIRQRDGLVKKESEYSEMNHLQILWNQSNPEWPEIDSSVGGQVELPGFYRMLTGKEMIPEWMEDFFENHAPPMFGDDDSSSEEESSEEDSDSD